MSKDDEKKKIDKIDCNRILYNAIKTPDGTILESKHRHDYVSYTDKNGQSYSVDGGTDYIRRGFDVRDYEDISVYDDESHENRIKYLTWVSYYDKNMNRLPEPISRSIKDMDTSHIESILDGNWCKDGLYLEVFKQELINRNNVSS